MERFWKPGRCDGLLNPGHPGVPLARRQVRCGPIVRLDPDHGVRSRVVPALHVGVYLMAEQPSSDLQPSAEMPPAAAPSDQSLLRRLREGNQDAALQIYLRY